MARGEIVVGHHLEPVGEQTIDGGTADEAGAARDEDAFDAVHAFFLQVTRHRMPNGRYTRFRSHASNSSSPPAAPLNFDDQEIDDSTAVSRCAASRGDACPSFLAAQNAG